MRQLRLRQQRIGFTDELDNERSEAMAVKLPLDIGYEIASGIVDVGHLAKRVAFEIDRAAEEERERCAKIVNELMEEVRSKAMGAEYHLVLAEKRIRDTP